MGLDKDGIEEAADAGGTAARINEYRCSRCGEIPPYEEREIYFDTKMCGWCLHQSHKDD